MNTLSDLPLALPIAVAALLGFRRLLDRWAMRPRKRFHEKTIHRP